MNCPDCQSRIGDLLDAGEALAIDEGVAGHLAECPACREFHDTWAALEPALTRHSTRAVLPANFKSSLLEKLPACPRRLPPAEIPALRKQFIREHAETLAGLRWGRTPGLVHRALLVAVACVGTGWLATHVISAFADNFGADLAQGGTAESVPFSHLALIAGPAALLLGCCRGVRAALWRVASYWRARLSRLLP